MTTKQGSTPYKLLRTFGILFCAKIFLRDVYGKHIKVMIDNIAAVSIINNMGTYYSYPCNKMTFKIWILYVKRILFWLTAVHTTVKENVTEDYESRNFNLDTERCSIRSSCLRHYRKDTLVSYDLFICVLH